MTRRCSRGCPADFALVSSETPGIRRALVGGQECLGEAVDRGGVGSGYERRFAGWVQGVRIGAKITVRRDVFLKQHHQMLELARPMQLFRSSMTRLVLPSALTCLWRRRRRRQRESVALGPPGSARTAHRRIGRAVVVGAGGAGRLALPDGAVPSRGRRRARPSRQPEFAPRGGLLHKPHLQAHADTGDPEVLGRPSGLAAWMARS